MRLTRRSAIVLASAGLVAPFTASACSEQPSQRLAAWQRDFERNTMARMDRSGVAGVAASVTSARNGACYARAFGYADIGERRTLTVDTPMHLASVSKLFTASALVGLFEAGGHDLDADVNEYLDYAVLNTWHPSVPITPRQLLTHTSSISDDGYEDRYETAGLDDPGAQWAAFLPEYLTVGGRTYSPTASFTQSTPGFAWRYSNVAIALAGHLVERVSGVPFTSYVHDHLLAPLGVENARWHFDEYPRGVLATPYAFADGTLVPLPQEGYADLPAGMLRCSIVDLTTCVRAMVGTNPKRPSILSQTSIEAMLRTQVDPSIARYQGLGWTEETVNGTPYVGHSGSDSGATNLVLLTKERDVIAILANTDSTERNDAFFSTVASDLLAGASLL